MILLFIKKAIGKSSLCFLKVILSSGIIINLIMKLKNEETKYHGFDLPVFLICEPGLRAGRGGFGHVYERLAERSEPIPGVTVMIRGEKGEKGNGALTKMDGSFRLKADRNATLIFSYMGFRTVEMKVAKAKRIWTYLWKRA